MKSTILAEANEFKKACLLHAENFVIAARLLLDNGLHHLAFAQSIFALEEVGKATLVGINAVAKFHSDNEPYADKVDDHQAKLFWAIWGPSFGTEVISTKQADGINLFAKNLHQRRMDAMYVDVGNIRLIQ